MPIGFSTPVLALVGGSAKSLAPLRAYLRKDKTAELAVSAIAWFEFLCGPSFEELSEEELEVAESFVGGRIVAADGAEAALAATLFNRVGRKKGLQADCIIAATAILAGARLFTLHSEDFSRFEPYGLRLLR